MNKNILAIILSLAIATFIFLSVFLIAYDDNIFYKLFWKLKCKMGKHTFQTKVGFSKRNVYYCKSCKIRRNYPKLSLIEGSNKRRYNPYDY